jgi:hypothetical protein
MQIDRDSTEYLYIGVSGQVPSVGAEIAFVQPPARPTAPDWNDAVVVPNSSDPLWADAVASGVTGNYYVAILVGAFGTGGVELVPNDYQAWLRLTDTIEQPVRVAPAAVEVL